MSRISIRYTSYDGCPEATKFSKDSSMLRYFFGVLCMMLTFPIGLALISIASEMVQNKTGFSSILELIELFLLAAGVLSLDFLALVVYPSYIEQKCLDLVMESKDSKAAKRIIYTKKELVKASLKSTAINFFTLVLPIILGVLCLLQIYTISRNKMTADFLFCIIGILISILVFAIPRIRRKIIA